MIRNSFYILSFILLAMLMFFIGLDAGSFDTDVQTIKEALFAYDSNNKIHYIILHLRMPRIVLAFLVGAALSLSGYLMQAMVNNPLAEPYILGTASGASLGANLVYIGTASLGYINIFLPSLGAFLGAMAVTLIAILIAYDKGQFAPTKLLLAGIALSSFMVALISLLIYIANDDGKLRSIIYWSMGSFERAQWEFIPLLSLTVLMSVILFLYMNKNISILLLGENRAYNLGLEVKKLRWIILAISSLLTGFAVATAGPIGFVGLMIPHLVRGLFGVNGKLNILYAALIGGIFMLVCDIASRILFKPAGIPIGILTSFLGIPFFVYLLSKRNYKFS